MIAAGMCRAQDASGAARACEPAEARATIVPAPDQDGIMTLPEGQRIRLANIVWPDHLEPLQRNALLARLTSALAGQTISWKPAAGPDRWGITPAHIFVQEKGGAQAPFWLQAGLVEAGLVPAWLDPADAPCTERLTTHEARAIVTRRGIWAPRTQAARHRAIKANAPAHAGQRMVAIWRVRSVKPWRSMHFVNIVPSFRGGPSIGLTRRQVAALNAAGKNPLDWKNKWIVARFILGPAGLSRIRVDAISPLAMPSRHR